MTIGAPRVARGLTKAQERVLTMIRTFVDDEGYPPTRFDICYALGFKSLNAAQEHLRALQRKGFVEIVPHVARGIRVNK